MDFVFAWILLTLAGYFLGIVLGDASFVLAILAAAFLLPIAAQVLRVLAILQPSGVSTYLRRTKAAVYTVYAFAALACLVLAVLLLAFTDDGRYFAWVLMLVGVLLVLGFPLLKPHVDRYLAMIIAPGSTREDKRGNLMSDTDGR